MKFFCLLLITFSAFANPGKEMNEAFSALVEIIPYMNSEKDFTEKTNERVITEKLTLIKTAFKKAKHDNLLKNDLFAPSYLLINEHIDGTLEAFKQGKKNYALWRLKETSSLCIDCHTRMPLDHSPSFNPEHYTIDTTRLTNRYDLGMAQLIVRRYTDAKKSFIQDIEMKLKDKKDIDLIDPFKQILLIEMKVFKDPKDLLSFLGPYIDRKDIPQGVKTQLIEWRNDLKNPLLKSEILNDHQMNNFIKNDLSRFSEDTQDVKLLYGSGIISRYLFNNPSSKLAPEISYWMGWIEKRLKRENFFSSGDLFLKQCIKRYPKNPVAKKCLAEYEESIHFEFSGSSGLHIPPEILKELESLKKLIPKT